MEGLRKDPLDYKNTLVLRLMMLVGSTSSTRVHSSTS